VWRCLVLAALLAGSNSGCSTRTGRGEGEYVRVENVTSPPPLPQPTGPFFVADPTTKVVPILRADAPNLRYANLERDACLAELARRNVPFVDGEATPGVLAPVRLRGSLHGVEIHSNRSTKSRKRSIYEVFDCRLVLALDDFAELVAEHGVTEIIHSGAYRPTTELGCTRRYWGLQHCAALAVDIQAFRYEDGTTLHVDRDFHGRIGLGTCASDVAPLRRTHGADELWAFVCGAAERALFNVMLTPNYNAEHRNHFHLELTPEAGWMMVH
jgi:hypothetical protein